MAYIKEKKRNVLLNGNRKCGGVTNRKLKKRTNSSFRTNQLCFFAKAQDPAKELVADAWDAGEAHVLHAVID